MSLVPLVLSLLACAGGDPGTTPLDTPPGADSAAVDSAYPTDSADPTLVPVTVTASGPIVCAAPDRRAAEPMVLQEGGPDWQAQAAHVSPETTTYGQGVVVGDFDGDGLLDILLPNVGSDELFLAAGDGTWALAPGRLPANSDHTEAASAVDVDDDGDLDILAVNRGEPNALWLNDGTGHFSVHDAGFLQEDFGSVGSTWGDVNGDGTLDLVIGAHFNRAGQEGRTPPPTGALGFGTGDPNEFYLGLGGGRFENRGDTLPPDSVRCFTFSPGLHDLDLDGDLDLYLVNDFGTLSIPNVLLRNDSVDQEPVWTDISLASGAGRPLQGMGLGVGDVSRDGLPDLLVSSWSELALFVSSPDGIYVDEAISRGLSLGDDSRFVAWGAELVDMDNDGDLDAAVSFGQAPGLGENPVETNPAEQPDGLWLQGDDGAFTQVADAWGVADRAIAMGFAATDLDDDGFVDLVKRFVNAPARIYTARCDDSGWLRVRLHQPAPNVAAVGARLVLEAGGTSQVRTIQIGGTNLSSSVPAEAHFGLGAHDRVDRLEITWPDGQRSVVRDVDARQILDVRR